MEQKVNRFLDFLNRHSTGSVTRTNEPQIGFKISYCEKLAVLSVKVIGAKQLPTNYGPYDAKGYIVKVTAFPGKEKFETRILKDNWPTINQAFTFNLNANALKATFVSFTIYAVLEEQEEEKPVNSSKGLMKRFFSFDENSAFLRNNVRRSFSRRSFRNSLKDRRTIGTVTYNIERKNFTQTHENSISTPDVWRSIKEITSGIQTQPREGKKGCIELTLQYSISEDGTNDVVEVTVTKFRCGLQTMQDHEKVGGQLYIKTEAFESDEVVQKKKSDKFDPTISLKLEANSATLRATINKFMLNYVKIVIRLMAKNLLGKKTLLGRIEIDKNEQFWKEIVASPGVPITKMVYFE